jgi:hypothetical protein
LLPTGVVLDSLAQPMIYAAAVGGIGNDYTALSWRDSSWVQRWSLGYGVNFMYPGDGPPGRYPLIWQTLRPEGDPNLTRVQSPAGSQYGYGYLVMSEDLGDTYARPDTIAQVDPYSFIYAAATAPPRRWAVKVNGNYGLRLFSLDSAGKWTERVIRDNSKFVFSIAIQTLDDTSVVVAWPQISSYRLHWGVLRGSSWEEKPPTPFGTGMMSSLLALHRAGPAKFWAAWSEGKPYHLLSRLDVAEESWALPDTLGCAFRWPGQWGTNSTYFSPDTLRYPVVAWTAQNFNRGAMNSLCVCVPTESGEYPVAENLEGTDGIAQAGIARDANEDIWVVWWNDELEGMFWTHSVVRATATALCVARGGSKPLLRWTLSEPAPGSWWTVLRADRDGPFETVGRVRAGNDTEMSWVDAWPVHGHVRYRLRRDCVDKRYEWLSEEAPWPVKSRKPLLSLLPRPLESSEVPFEVEWAAAGPMQIELYDIQGRRVLTRTEPGTGLATVSSALDLTQLERRCTSGIYFLRVTDAAGERSEAAKVVVLR